MLVFSFFFPPSLTLTCMVLLFQQEHGLAREDLSSNNLMLIFCYLKDRLV